MLNYDQKSKNTTPTFSILKQEKIDTYKEMAFSDEVRNSIGF
jgi:hypothetical protein